jgi:nanoRNase/pAp phosphatase (c-di-AMP/oligoRNAs hydrolase)
MSLNALQDKKRHRLITRSDFDGLVSAMLLSDLGVVDSITFAHPKDIQDKITEVTNDDILSNLPYNENALLVFDHHSSEKIRIPSDKDNWVIDPSSPSAARLIWKSFGGEEYFGTKYNEMLEAVDRADSAAYTLAEVLNPTGWNLLNFIMDARTGLGRFKDFRISNYQLMIELVDLCRKYPVDQVLAQPDVKERVDLYCDHQDRFIEQLRSITNVHGRVAEVNLLGETILWVGNRFLIYTLYPEIKVSMHMMWGKTMQTVVFAVGQSIFNKTCGLDIGALMLKYGGGGHRGAGTCQVATPGAEVLKNKLIAEINHSVAE